jgi:uncharacterized membrane protein YkvA (DUF1232 family)
MADTSESATQETAKRTQAKKTAKKTAAKKTPAKKTAATKSAAKKTAAKKSPTKKTAAKRTVKRTAAKAAPSGTTSSRAVATGRALVAQAGNLFTRAPAVAQSIVADPEALRGLADKALHSQSGRTGPVGEVVDDFRTLGRLVAAYSRGDYRDIPLDSLVMVIAGLLYVVSPIDLIPDALPVAGYADDVVAVGFVIRQVHHELAAFREWEARG